MKAYVNRVMLTPFEPRAKVRVLDTYKDNETGRIIAEVEYLEPHYGYEVGEVGSYLLDELIFIYDFIFN
jgi:hypothetical protein